MGKSPLLMRASTNGQVEDFPGSHEFRTFYVEHKHNIEVRTDMSTSEPSEVPLGPCPVGRR